jgi:hypothetical protein
LNLLHLLRAYDIHRLHRDVVDMKTLIRNIGIREAH